MSKKKVLVFIDWFRPGYKAGGPVASLDNLTAQLSGEIDFYIVTRDTDYCETKPYADVKANQWNEFSPGVHVYYISAARIRKNTLRKLLAEREYDRYYVNGIYSPFFSILPLNLLRSKRNRTIVAARGMLAESAIAIKAGRKKIYLALAKFFGIYKGLTFHATSEQEVRDIKNVFGESARVVLAENLPRKTPPQIIPIEKRAGELRLICLARVAPEKNNLYALQVLKPVKSRVTIDFYGSAYDEAYANACRAFLRELPGNVSAAFHDPVPAGEVPHLLQNYHALFLPTRGENFGHVILESLGSARPVIVSDRTPWQDLQEKKAGFVLPLDQPEAFTKAIESLAAMDAATYRQYCENAAKRAAEFSGDSKLVEASRKLFE